MAKITIAEGYRWLYRVPKSAIIDFLIKDKSEDSVRKAIHILDDSVSGELFSLLVNFDYVRVIYVFQKCTETTPQETKELYRRYRYRGMKTLHIYSRNGTCDLHSLNMSALNMVINTKVSELKDSTKKFCNLEIREIESIDNSSIRELSYTYHGFIPYIPPDTEYPDYVTDLRRGFIWIPERDPWICICAKDDIVAQVLHESLKKHFGFESKALPLTKTVQQGLEDMESIRKAGYVSTGGTARRLSNPQMSGDSEAMEECRQRDNLDDRPLAGFNVDLEGRIFSLSYNESGKIYFSIDLEVDQMREWGVGKIRDIVQFINGLRLTEPGSLFGTSLRALNGTGNKSVKSAIVEIASAIARCKKESVSDVPLKSDVFALAGNLGKYIKTRFRIFCSKCNDYSEIVCDCGDVDDFSIENGHIKCRKCVNPISKISCFDGHKSQISQVETFIELLPLCRLNDLIVNIFKEVSELNFIPSQESFSIKNDRLFYRHDASKTVYRINEIPKYKQDLIAVPETEISAIKKALTAFKEKCDKTSKENCAQCIENDIGTKCYLRLFGLFDSDYKPRPHHGHEFGDYSTLVSIENQQKTMVIAMKSKTKRIGRNKVTLRDGVGSDIFSQVGSYLHDGRMDVIGVCVPLKLEDGFAAMLKKDAQDKNKKLLIIDDDDLVQIAYSAMKKNNLALEKI